jgi:succinyl-CoA synthetase beta subunit
MMLIEYAGKQLLSKYGVPIPRGHFVKTPDDAAKVCMEMGEAVLKVQVPAGGRGKAGGVKIVDAKKDDVVKIAKDLLSNSFSGFQPLGLLVEEKVNISQETYMGFTIDDAKGVPLFLFSLSGGINIEENWNSSRGVSVIVDPMEGVWEFRIRNALIDLGLDASLAIKIASIANNAYQAFRDLNCRLLEINPLAILKDGNVIALDVKVDIDEDAVYRLRPEIKSLIALSSIDSIEERARGMGLNFVLLNVKGEVGVITGGAGLGMATIDILFEEGYIPANFLDLGGGVTKEKVKNAMSLVAKLPELKCIFVNVYGGINNLAEIASGIVEAKTELGIKIPILVKMRGHFEKEAKKILDESGIVSVISSNTRETVRLLRNLMRESE